MTKKHYTKPEILFVDFSLNASIAATCYYRANHYNDSTCEYVDETGAFAPEDKMFDTGLNSECTVNYDCYHVPDESTSIFSS